MTDGQPETVVSASLQKIKSIKNPINFFIFYFYFIKSETSDSFVSHFDGHFAYLKTLDLYFNRVGEPMTATSTFTQFLRFEEVLQVNMVLNVHRNHKVYYGRGRGVKVNIVLSVHRNHRAY